MNIEDIDFEDLISNLVMTEIKEDKVYYVSSLVEYFNDKGKMPKGVSEALSDLGYKDNIIYELIHKRFKLVAPFSMFGNHYVKSC